MRATSFFYLSILVFALYGLAVVVKSDNDMVAAALSGHPLPVVPVARGSQSGKRPVYPYSIVPGGVASQKELKIAMRHDPLVAKHYAAVDVDGLKPVTLGHQLAAYVSFRKHGQVYWTSRKVKIAKGERLLVGENQGIGVRERCGNQVSEQPRTPVLADLGTEPSGATFDTPVERLAAGTESFMTAATSREIIPEQVAAAENGASEVPLGAGTPGVYQSGGAGGGLLVGGSGGTSGGGGGGGAGGGGIGSTGQPVSTSPPSSLVTPEVITPMPVTLPVGSPITTPLPPAPMGWSYLWMPSMLGPAPWPVPVPLSIPSATQTARVYPWMPVSPPAGSSPPVSQLPVGTPEQPPTTVPQLLPNTPPGVRLNTPPGTPAESPIAPVPEPSTWLMLGAGLGILALLRSRRSGPQVRTAVGLH